MSPLTTQAHLSKPILVPLWSEATYWCFRMEKYAIVGTGQGIVTVLVVVEQVKARGVEESSTTKHLRAKY